MKAWSRWLLPCMVLAVGACSSLSPLQRERALRIANDARSTASTCDRPDACAAPSPLRELGTRAYSESSPEAPHHYALLLDYGQDALLARLNLIRSASREIDLQTYIFDEDDAGHLVLDELLDAARRGVRVRVLIDQLSALRHVDTLAALAGAHANFEVRIYNPVLGRARINYPQYVLAAACCWRRLNQRMHSKLLLVDGLVGITGGRNYQNDYYDWDAAYNFRDRDVLVAGPVTREMAENFEAFWNARRTRRIAELVDVGHRILSEGVPALPQSDFALPERAQRMARDAADEALVDERLVAAALPVGKVEFLADLPQKHRRSNEDKVATSSHGLRELIASAQHEVLLQTPYLVLSPAAQQLFRELHDRDPRPRVIVSTNSLAATDAFITYALSYKYKRRYLRDFGFEIHEFKPFPQDAPIDLDATGSVGVEWQDAAWSRTPARARILRVALVRLFRQQTGPAAAQRRAFRPACEVDGDRRAHRRGRHPQFRSARRPLQHGECGGDRRSRLRPCAGRQHPARYRPGQCLDHRAPRQAAGLRRARVFAGEDLRAIADLRPVAGPLCDQLRVQAGARLPVATAAQRPAFPPVLHPGG